MMNYNLFHGLNSTNAIIDDESWKAIVDNLSKTYRISFNGWW
jgi:hypothetical protein